MKAEVIIGLCIFSFLILNFLQFLIRKHCQKVQKRKAKAISEFKARREEVERKARRQL
ncbi:hypothetical protein [Serratia ureilytica]|uniref:hypothetical protein n=1 Tax=Serratia ureilytica TaxID=300181 RepID=UPI003714B875